MPNEYPGTARHQALLERIVQHYAGDSRIRAVCLFGSLVRGNWDANSDLDLDVVVEEGTRIEVISELYRLCAAFQTLSETPLIVVPSGPDAGDVVLSSLAELSIRYHPLATTSPNIVDHLQLLTGRIDLQTILAAGEANRQTPRSVTDDDVDRCLRWAAGVNVSVRRRRFWQAVQLQQLIRDTLIEIFAFSRGYPRAYPAFEAHADAALQERMGRTLPQPGLQNVQRVQEEILAILENALPALSNGRLQLNDRQRQLIARLREPSPRP